MKCSSGIWQRSDQLRLHDIVHSWRGLRLFWFRVARGRQEGMKAGGQEGMQEGRPGEKRQKGIYAGTGEEYCSIIAEADVYALNRRQDTRMCVHRQQQASASCRQRKTANVIAKLIETTCFPHSLFQCLYLCLHHCSLSSLTSVLSSLLLAVCSYLSVSGPVPSFSVLSCPFL